jgi:hypothetical protein
MVALKDCLQRAGLILSADQEDHVGGIIQYRQGECDAIGVERLHPRRHDQALLLADGVGPRKEQGGVPITLSGTRCFS